MTDSIHDLFQKVRQHPDFAGGTIFTRDDVSGVLDIDPDDVTDEQMSEAETAIESFIFNGVYTWVDAMKDCVA